MKHIDIPMYYLLFWVPVHLLMTLLLPNTVHILYNFGKLFQYKLFLIDKIQILNHSQQYPQLFLRLFFHSANRKLSLWKNPLKFHFPRLHLLKHLHLHRHKYKLRFL